MTGWLIRRTADAALTALVAVVLLVILVHLLPGDPLAPILRDRGADPATAAALAARWGTNRTILQSLAALFTGVIHGDLGLSLSAQRPVLDVLADHLGPTLLLGSLTLLIDFTVGLALGVWTALHADLATARWVSALSVVGYTVPSFVVGTVLVWLFAVKLGWLPSGSIADPLLSSSAGTWAILADHLRHLVLPLAALVIATIAVPLRQQRSAVFEVAAQPWVLAARARGVAPARIAWRHCWRPALTPIVTLLGLWLPLLVAGAVFVEVVFNWPGMGLLLAQATIDRDVPVVVAGGALLIVTVQAGSLLADVLYHVVDPRQRPT
ncbi:MAG TPA: ABC transporter permease [Gemmatimonadales bacterium]